MGAALRELDRPSLPFDIVESKVHVPAQRDGTVSRTALVNRLRADRSFALLTVVAPAGYGKTTLLAQWAHRDERPFAWVSIDERDDDPVVLLRHVAAALDRVEAISSSLVDALKFPGASMWTAVVPRLTAAVASLSRPTVIVLDDAHLLAAGEPADAVAALVEHLPEGSALAVAGRAPPPLPLAALRTGGRLLELGTDELALTRREAALLLRGADAALPDEAVDELFRRSEGWSGALYLAALSLGRRPDEVESQRSVDFAGDDPYLADYFRSEYLSHLTQEELSFLRQTSVLERMCGALCDAVLETEGSALRLESVERSNLFLVPLDRHREWYRYHRLFHELLERELVEHEPDLVCELHRRAADWFESHDDPESALAHAHASGDIERAARIVASLALPAYCGGRGTTVERWLERFADEAVLRRYPTVAVPGAGIHALRGRPAEAERWLAAAERGIRSIRGDDRILLRPMIAVIRAGMCAEGVKKMLRDGARAVLQLPADHQWRPSALLLTAVAHALLGELEPADRMLHDAADLAERLGAADTRMVALSQRALLAAARGGHGDAETLAAEARELVQEGYATSVLTLAISARARLRHGRWDEARTDLAAAEQLTPLLTHATPWLGVQARLELAHAHVTLRDSEGARKLLTEIEEIFGRRPDLGILAEQTEALARALEAMPEDVKASGLTGAELRLVPYLATHLSFREIGERLHLSRNTIKTQAISIYRKLGVSTRSDAIDRAVDLGLVDVATPPRGDFIHSG